MSLTTTEKQLCQCSCGRSFAHMVSLKRHCFVSGHTAVQAESILDLDAPVEVAVVEIEPTSSEDVYSQAMAVLVHKMQVQKALDRRRIELSASPDMVAPSYEDFKGAAANVAGATLGVLGHCLVAARLALKFAILSVVVTGLLASGIKIGSMLA